MPKPGRAELVRESIAHMRNRYRDKKTQTHSPTVPCPKCGALFWEHDYMEDMWYCVICAERFGQEDEECCM